MFRCTQLRNYGGFDIYTKKFFHRYRGSMVQRTKQLAIDWRALPTTAKQKYKEESLRRPRLIRPKRPRKYPHLRLCKTFKLQRGFWMFVKENLGLDESARRGKRNLFPAWIALPADAQKPYCDKAEREWRGRTPSFKEIAPFHVPRPRPFSLFIRHHLKGKRRFADSFLELGRKWKKLSDPQKFKYAVKAQAIFLRLHRLRMMKMSPVEKRRFEKLMKGRRRRIPLKGEPTNFGKLDRRGRRGKGLAGNARHRLTPAIVLDGLLGARHQLPALVDRRRAPGRPPLQISA